jgi:hypothetical protein
LFIFILSLCASLATLTVARKAIQAVHADLVIVGIEALDSTEATTNSTSRSNISPDRLCRLVAAYREAH